MKNNSNNARKVWKEFRAQQSPEFNKVANAVINQLGGIDADTLRTLTYVRSGADGYGGFIYYGELRKFWQRYRRFILPYMEREAEDLGCGSALSMVMEFKYIRDHNYDTGEIGRALYGTMSADIDGGIYSVLGWYALELVAYRFSDFLYEAGITAEEIE